jgi:hypothetical protein
MNLKPKPGKRTSDAPVPRAPAPAPVAVARRARGPDLGDRRLQLLLAAVR